MSNKKGIFYTVMLLLIATTLNAADDVATYLILSDIPPYKRITQAIDAYSHKIKNIPGYIVYPGPGILAGADHFIVDHSDMTYEADYQSDELGLGADVQVTKHAGSDSDKWLLHEVERGFRDTDKLESWPDEDSLIREINNNKIFFYGGGVIGYRWLSNKTVINIQYGNLSGPKPEPLEIVKAYLVKLPSSIILSDVEFKAKAHSEKWIKDEMDRRLWLCDKWFLQITLKKADEKQVYQESVKSMNVFLDYREKYYDMKAVDEKNLLAGYLNKSDGTNIKVKLAEYKNWWTVNKSASITLP